MRIHDVEQGSFQWKALRLGKITGTRAKAIMAKDNLPVVDQLIAENISEEIEEDDSFISPAMERGSNYEPLARTAYEKTTGYKVEQFGFLQHAKYDWLGFSPDGLIRTGDKYTRAIEIKCPSTHTHVRYIRQNQIPNEYKYQIYTAFIVCQDLIELDFISYDTRFSIKPMHIINIKRESIQTEIEETESALVRFWEKYEKYYQEVTF